MILTVFKKPSVDITRNLAVALRRTSATTATPYQTHKRRRMRQTQTYVLGSDRRSPGSSTVEHCFQKWARDGLQYGYCTGRVEVTNCRHLCSTCQASRTRVGRNIVSIKIFCRHSTKRNPFQLAESVHWPLLSSLRMRLRNLPICLQSIDQRFTAAINTLTFFQKQVSQLCNGHLFGIVQKEASLPWSEQEFPEKFRRFHHFIPMIRLWHNIDVFDTDFKCRFFEEATWMRMANE